MNAGMKFVSEVLARLDANLSLLSVGKSFG